MRRHLALPVIGAALLACPAAAIGYDGPLRPLLPTTHDVPAYSSRSELHSLRHPTNPALTSGFQTGWEESLSGDSPLYRGKALVYQYRSNAAASRALRTACAGAKGCHRVGDGDYGKVDEAVRSGVITSRLGSVKVFCFYAGARRANVYLGGIDCALDPHQINARMHAVALVATMAHKLDERLSTESS